MLNIVKIWNKTKFIIVAIRKWLQSKLIDWRLWVVNKCITLVIKTINQSYWIIELLKTAYNKRIIWHENYSFRGIALKADPVEFERRG